METIYTASATATGGREGRVRTSDGVLDLELRTPGIKAGEGSKATNPEQLFAAGYAACYTGALNLAARLKRIETGEIAVTMQISLEKDEIKGYGISARIDVIIPGVDEKTAYELVDNANNICPYSKATRGNIRTDINVVVRA